LLTTLDGWRWPYFRYTSAKRKILSNKLIKVSDGVLVHVAASLAAGTIATTVCAPADVLKSRLQSAASAKGETPVRERSWDVVISLKQIGFSENIRDFAEEWRTWIFDERLDSSMA
jgi:hypothetical protein